MKIKKTMIITNKLRFKQNQSFSFLKSFSAKDIEKYLCDDEDNVPLIKENIETKPPITLYKSRTALQEALKIARTV